MSDPIEKLHALGQSIWYDNIQRRLLENGDLAAMIERGDIRGVTSNPSIFKNAIANSNDYDAALIPLSWAGLDAESVFWELATEDIRAACDLFRPLYDETGGGDGYVSIEVSPYLAHETGRTVAQAKELWARVDRPNLMVKIPATKEGLPAIRQAIAAGINVNVTLIFAIERYLEVMDAYLSGLEDRLAAGGSSLSSIASVASFFVSRIDTKVDALLPEGSPLRGKAAIASAKLAYQEYLRVFGGGRFAALKAKGARSQRPLWASTSTKNPAYPDTLYVAELIGPDTVNTVPPKTLDAFKDHGAAALTLTADVDLSRRALTDLEAAGVSMARVTQELEDEGVRKFADAFTDLLKTIDERRTAAASQLGPLQDSVKAQMSRLAADSVNARLWAHDPTLWTDDPAGQAEVKIRLGWLDLPQTSRQLAAEATAFAAEIRAAGIRKVLLLGMGGSSLAPEVISRIFRSSDPLTFSILDSTDPAQVAAAAESFPPGETLYVVASKSGGTAEVMAFFNYFWQQTGGDGSRFIAITDPGSPLEKLAGEKGFRRVFTANPNVGGRYSALTAFGLVPAALMGVDLGRLLDRAAWMAAQCGEGMAAARNPGLALGAVVGQAALEGRDKLTLVIDAGFRAFGSWAEQLVAESSGKDDRGILPVEGEAVGAPEVYGDDRLFVYLRQDGEQDAAVAALQKAGHPVLVYQLGDAYDLGAEFYRWEFATAVACHIIGVNAFDQPNVEDAKVRAKQQIAAYNQKGALDEGQPAWEGDGVKAFAQVAISAADLSAVLGGFLSGARAGDYVAIQAYLPRNEAVAAVLDDLRTAVRAKTGLATTVGFGPRFLHSTGQLHKGGPNNGLFLVITAEPETDFDIPAQGLTFGTLERAQVLGDYEALTARGRRVLRLHLPSVGGLSAVLNALA
ncbi:MAG: bifunctional transaldolase/phosoglucose isomerase [Chloroflexi bacterium]|nr:bifunctional transaldolase/phosoglucose isomerase [Chloroflexota bacterium]